MTFLTEKQMELILLRNTELIESGLSVYGSQIRVKGHSLIDILCLDKKKNFVLVELKITAHSPSVGQILRYRKSLEENLKKQVRLIICCLGATDHTKELCQEYNVKCVILNGKQLLKTRSLKYNELHMKTKLLLSYLYSVTVTKNLDQIKQDTQLDTFTIKKLISDISLFIPIHISTDKQGITTYGWPEGYEYEGIEDFEEFKAFGLEKFTYWSD